MEKCKFLIETDNFCCLCLTKVKDKKKNAAEGEGEGTSSSFFGGEGGGIASLQRIGKYLDLDVKTVLGGSNSMSVTSDADAAVASRNFLLEKSELIGFLCKECSEISGKFTELHGQLEVILLQLQSCLKGLQTKMERRTDDDDEEQQKIVKEFQAEFLKGPKEWIHYGIVDRLRKEMIKKCSKKLAQEGPLLLIKKMEITEAMRKKMQETSHADVSVPRAIAITNSSVSSKLHQHAQKLNSKLRSAKRKRTRATLTLPGTISTSGNDVNVKENEAAKVKITKRNQSLPNFKASPYSSSSSTPHPVKKKAKNELTIQTQQKENKDPVFKQRERVQDQAEASQSTEPESAIMKGRYSLRTRRSTTSTENKNGGAIQTGSKSAVFPSTSTSAPSAPAAIANHVEVDDLINYEGLSVNPLVLFKQELSEGDGELEIYDDNTDSDYDPTIISTKTVTILHQPQTQMSKNDDVGVIEVSDDSETEEKEEEDDDEEQMSSLLFDPASMKFLCTFSYSCKATFEKRQELLRHKKEQHEAPPPPRKAIGKRVLRTMCTARARKPAYECSNCFAAYYEMKHLNIHLQTEGACKRNLE